MENLVGKAASKAERSTANAFLAQALVEKSIPMSFVESSFFKGYVAYISGGRFKAPTVYGLIASIDGLYERLHTIVRKKLSDRAFIAFEMDSLTRGGRHFSALCTGAPGLSALAAVYDNSASDNAVNTADACHRCAAMIDEVSSCPALPQRCQHCRLHGKRQECKC